MNVMFDNTVDCITMQNMTLRLSALCEVSVKATLSEAKPGAFIVTVAKAQETPR